MERAALGYLHGNCGNCHNQEGPLAVLDMTLAQRVATTVRLGGGAGFPGRCAEPVPRARRTRRRTARRARAPASQRPSRLRMNSRDPLQQMPPLGTVAVDAGALALLQRWIEGLNK